MKSKQLTHLKSAEQIKQILRKYHTQYDPEQVLIEAQKERGKIKESQFAVDSNSNLFKSLTLHELDNGMLMTATVPEQYRAFGINLMRNIQQEYSCQTTSEKATAELATINYIRTLEIQRRINNYLALGRINDTGVKFLDILSKELDRANRHYLAAIQILRYMKQIPLQITVKANTAVIGQNQFVQANSHG